MPTPPDRRTNRGIGRASLVAAAVLFSTLLLVGGFLAYMKRGVLFGWGVGPPQGGFQPPQAIEIATAQEVMWNPESDLVGTVISLRSVRVSNELAGVVKTVRFESGSVVEAGDTLLTLGDATERADLEAAKALVRVAEANVALVDARIVLADSEYRRLQSATQARAIAEMELDRARAEVDKAQADRARYAAEVDQARAQVAQTQAKLDKMTIKAPFRARAGLRSVHEGQYLAEGSSVVMLEEVADKIYLDFAIPQEYIARVRPGVVVMATSPVFGPDPVRIEVAALDASVSFDTRNVRVRAIVDNKTDLLRPGMFIQIRVPVEAPKPYIIVPSTAIRRTSYADQVFVIENNDPPPPGVDPMMWAPFKAGQRFVKLGPTVGDNTVVLEGVKAGDRVASTGSFKLHEGAPVMDAAMMKPPPGGPPGGAPSGGTTGPSGASAGKH